MLFDSTPRGKAGAKRPRGFISFLRDTSGSMPEEVHLAFSGCLASAYAVFVLWNDGLRPIGDLDSWEIGSVIGAFLVWIFCAWGLLFLGKLARTSGEASVFQFLLPLYIMLWPPLALGLAVSLHQTVAEEALLRLCESGMLARIICSLRSIVVHHLLGVAFFAGLSPAWIAALVILGRQWYLRSRVRSCALKALPIEANLQGASWLRGIRLQGGALAEVNLEGANLTNADLRKADLREANLRDTTLTGANLTGADLRDANLEEAALENANLDGAILAFAHLEGANLWRANLEGANVTADELAQAKSLAGATLPDGTNLSFDNWQAEFEEWRKKQKQRETSD